jgi:cell division transport system permease protein
MLRAREAGRARKVRPTMNRTTYIVAAAWQGFWRNPVMSLASTFTVGLMLLLFAFFLATDRGLQAAVGVLESKVELALFLEDDARVSDILALRARVEADPAVARVDYVTKDEAMRRLETIAEQRPDIQIVDISSNPLPASLEIKLARAQDAQRVAADLRQEIGKGVVYEVVDNPSVVDKLLTITRVLSIGGVAVLLMMLIVALFVIINTIRIAVHARRDEIEIMKLVGATDWFVRWPFILEGMLVGALGAAAALLVILAAAGPVTNALVGFLEVVPLSFGSAFLWQLVASVLALALGVGGGGAMLSVRTHLAK